MGKKRVTALLTITVSVTPGVCRWCRCSYYDPCEGGCGWANRAQTLCTACVDFDRLTQTARGRAELVGAFNQWQDTNTSNAVTHRAARRSTGNVSATHRSVGKP
jgi:hypothetical protein